MLLKVQLLWSGHVVSMGEERIPKQLLFDVLVVVAALVLWSFLGQPTWLSLWPVQCEAGLEKSYDTRILLFDHAFCHNNYRPVLKLLPSTPSRGFR